MKHLYAAALFLLLSVSAINSSATVSCDPKYKFLGFSEDLKSAFWEVKTGGDCMPSRDTYRYDFETQRAVKTRKSKLAGVTLNLPEPFVMESGGAKINIFVKGGKNGKVDGWESRGKIIYKDNAKTCALKKPIFKQDEGGQYPAKKVRSAYYNKGYDSWVLIREHCYAASQSGYNGFNCPTNQSIAIYEMNNCLDKN